MVGSYWLSDNLKWLRICQLMQRKELKGSEDAPWSCNWKVFYPFETSSCQLFSQRLRHGPFHVFSPPSSCLHHSKSLLFLPPSLFTICKSYLKEHICHSLLWQDLSLACTLHGPSFFLSSSAIFGDLTYFLEGRLDNLMRLQVNLLTEGICQILLWHRAPSLAQYNKCGTTAVWPHKFFQVDAKKSL
jgi:hypothetical protein